MLTGWVGLDLVAASYYSPTLLAAVLAVLLAAELAHPLDVAYAMRSRANITEI